MPQIRLVADAPEGGPGNLVQVSRSRAQDLVNAGIAQRVMETRDVIVESDVTPDTSARDALVPTTTRRTRQRNR